MVTSSLNENPSPSLERMGHQIKNMLRNFQVHKSIDKDLNTYHNKDKGIKS